MPRMPNVTDADIVAYHTAAERFVDDAHELIARIEKGYSGPIDDIPSHAKHLTVIAEAANTLAKHLLLKNRELERLRAAFDEQNFGRLAVIEECARVIEQWENDDTPRSYLDLIAAIRALKDKP